MAHHLSLLPCRYAVDDRDSFRNISYWLEQVRADVEARRRAAVQRGSR